MAKCRLCGEPDCWDENDFSWLASRSGWGGELHGCATSIFFIHGKKIREQRTIPTGSWSIAEVLSNLPKWSAGLPDARLVWSLDTGDDHASLWIEGVREPNEEDWHRLREARARQRREDERELEMIHKRLAMAD